MQFSVQYDQVRFSEHAHMAVCDCFWRVSVQCFQHLPLQAEMRLSGKMQVAPSSFLLPSFRLFAEAKHRGNMQTRNALTPAFATSSQLFLRDFDMHIDTGAVGTSAVLCRHFRDEQ